MLIHGERRGCGLLARFGGVEMLEREEGLSQVVLVCEGCCWCLVKISADISLSFYPSLVKRVYNKARYSNIPFISLIGFDELRVL